MNLRIAPKKRLLPRLPALGRALVLGACAWACNTTRADELAPTASAPQSVQSSLAGAAVVPNPGHADNGRSSLARNEEAIDPPCDERWRRVEEAPALPGAPTFDQQRALLLARAKAEPIVFVETPRWSRDVGATVKSFRRHLSAAKHHWDALAFQLRRFRARPDIGRAVLLRDGYLYAEHPHLAYAFEQLVQPEHLFDAPRIWIQRGEQLFWADRTDEGTYIYERSTAAHPVPVNLLHLDRVGVGTPPASLHVDVRALRSRLHFDRMRVLRLTKDHVLAELAYGKENVKAVLERRGPALSVVCEISPSPDLAREKQRAAIRGDAILRLQRAMHAQVVEAPPFDEPRDEQGVEDGVLRPMWVEAHSKGRRHFRLRDEAYDVYNRAGRPVPPQVCVDFLTDTLERASGTWWSSAAAAPRREVGGLDLSTFGELEKRRVVDLVRFAESQPSWFDVRQVAADRRVPIGHRERFFSDLIAADDPPATGDIIIVRGYTEADQVRMHTHSFFVYETDPLTGVPIAVAGNAGMPHIWSLEGESRREPARTVRYVLRPREELLRRVIGGEAGDGGPPAPLVEEDI